ncbi:helix-turn-helix transcriptional regulator [Streptomyces sp. WG5]|uniref:helix-turn-helix transcriptional regulator n=1 Tax=Streptomyces sp. WG5 TaxID=3417648 RepID=UPI003CECF844
MPIDSGLTDALLVKYFYLGLTDKEIAKKHGITPQAVVKRRKKQGLFRKPVSMQVNEYLSQRWDIWAPKEGTGHHNLHSAKALKVWLRCRLGDDTLSDDQLHMAKMWEQGLRERDEVLCYDPSTKKGWYYRTRVPADGRLVIDWPRSIPFPDEKFKKALELPPKPA